MKFRATPSIARRKSADTGDLHARRRMDFGLSHYATIGPSGDIEIGRLGGCRSAVGGNLSKTCTQPAPSRFYLDAAGIESGGDHRRAIA